ncbi:MAG: DHA2 family efflux MFS transporter permease subunit [Ilumatobacteraceae bacterium]
MLRFAEPDAAQVHRRRWAILALLCTSLLIVVVGNTTLNVTLPTLSRELGATESQLQWVVAIYSLVFAGLLFTTGALGDRFGRKGALQLGLVIFLVGSILASMGTTMTQLIVCRALMGVGASLIMPSTLSILINVFPAHERPKAIAIWASVTGAGGSLGPLISGALLAHFWWGSVFLVNVPLVVGAIVVGVFLMPRSRDPHKAPLDPLGAVLSTIGIVAIVYALIEAPSKGWASTETIVSALFGVLFLIGFVAWERHTPEPMLDMAYFKVRAFSTGVGGMIFVFVAIYGQFFLLSQYFQQVLGYSPLGASARLLPTGLVIVLVAPSTPRITAKLGGNWTVGLGMTLLGLALLSFALLTTTSPYWQVLASMTPMAAGIALTSSPMTSAIMSAVPARRAGAGSSMNDATRELGSALGIAILGSLAASRYSSAIGSALGGIADPGGQSRAKGSLAGAIDEAAKLPDAARRALVDAASNAFVDGLHLAVIVGGIGALAAAVFVVKYLPRTVVHEGALHSAAEALEAEVELLIGGVMPIVEDDVHAAKGDVVNTFGHARRRGDGVDDGYDDERVAERRGLDDDLADEPR